MIFDMTGSGLAQMDMELIRFIVTCFKLYFPDLLGFLLVYNMPWILQGYLVKYRRSPYSRTYTSVVTVSHILAKSVEQCISTVWL